jgi:DNA repair protein RecO (recombination protein O)
MQKYTAIILFSRDMREYDRMYAMYTLESGLVTAVAKGARKPAARLAGHLEPGTLSEVYVAKSRGKGQITGAITLSGFEKIKRDLDKLQEVLEIFRFIGRIFSEGEKDEKIFLLVKNFLEIIDSDSERLERSALGYRIAVVSFWWKIFDLLGHRPEVMRCIICGSSLRGREEINFSAEKGGAVCESCSARGRNLISVSESQIKLLRAIFTNSLDKIIKIKLPENEVAGAKRLADIFRRHNF